MFMSIYGCGSVASNKLYEMGLRSVESLRANFDALSKKLHVDHERLRYGLTYYDDLSLKKITIEECKFIFEDLKNLILENVDSKCQIELMGGFRRYRFLFELVYYILFNSKIIRFTRFIEANRQVTTWTFLYLILNKVKRKNLCPKSSTFLVIIKINQLRCFFCAF